MTAFLVIDVETTGEAPPHEIIELGYTLGISANDKPSHYFCAPEWDARLYQPTVACTPEARAVHHIHPSELQGASPCSDAELELATREADVLVAHNAAFERQWFTPEAIGHKPWICTYKAALRCWPDAPRHTNSVLRYWLEEQGLLPDLDRRIAEPAHRAGPDTWVTAHILGALLKRASVEDMVRWTDEPRLMPKITFGKHKGKKWGEVDHGYLEWVAFKSDMDDDTKWNAKRELGLRGARAH